MVEAAAAAESTLEEVVQYTSRAGVEELELPSEESGSKLLAEQ